MADSPPLVAGCFRYRYTCVAVCLSRHPEIDFSADGRLRDRFVFRWGRSRPGLDICYKISRHPSYQLPRRPSGRGAGPDARCLIQPMRHF